MLRRLSLLKHSISSGIASLNSHEYKGQFLGFSSTDPNHFGTELPLPTTFVTSLILLCLENIKGVTPSDTRSLAQFLLSQKTAHWSYNYWTRESTQARETPYPDDLDDTFCALAALFRYDPKLITGDVMAHIVLLLTATEVKEGGPYKTWLVPASADKVWQDVDIAVNANIAYFLSLTDITLPTLEKLIEKAIKKEEFFSRYYASEYPIIYFISRFYKGKSKETLRNYLLAKKKNNHWENPLNTALAISSLINLGISPMTLEKEIDYLLTTQTNSQWDAYPFYIDRIIKGTPYYVGASSLTSAFCLEALSRYSKNLTSKTEQLVDHATSDTLHSTILTNVSQYYSATPEMQRNITTLLPSVVNGELGRQITLLPHYFYSTLNKKRNEIPQELLRELGIANTLGWIAYTVYDDFLDNEGDKTLLGVANVALRELTKIFEHFLPENKEFHALVTTILADIDEANTWEILHCRFVPTTDSRDIVLPDYTDYAVLAKKSFGHILGPLAILFSLGYSKDSKEVTQTIRFFQHYLIARQLDDDAHDWEKDFAMGQLSPVVTLVLSDVQKTPENNHSLSLPTLQELFWFQTIRSVCTVLDDHVTAAEEILKQMTWIDNKEILYSLLKPIKQSLEKAKSEQENALLFMQTYT